MADVKIAGVTVTDKDRQEFSDRFGVPMADVNDLEVAEVLATGL